MKYETLKRLCLAYLEQDIDTNVMAPEVTIESLMNNDVFKEYLNNIDGSIYNAISRLVQSYKLPIKTFKIKSTEFEDNMSVLPKECYQVKEISLITKQGFVGNISYQVMGDSIFIPNIVENSTYIVVYYPRFLYFTDYLAIDNIEDINQLDLTKHGLPDELAITIKYAVYGDMKSEDNPQLAIVNRNYFESVLSENTRVDVITNQPSINVNRNEDWNSPDQPQRAGDPFCPLD